MTFYKHLQTVFLLAALSMIISACSNSANDLLEIGTFTKNNVTVSIYLSTSQDGENSLVASFVPPKGFHLYSKDIPRNGVDGLGRPTLLELTWESQMTAAGELAESAPAQIPDFEPKDLLVYPVGTVTLTLPITLPTGTNWVDDEISVTYMACSDAGCKAPVVNNIVSVRIPSAEINSNP